MLKSALKTKFALKIKGLLIVLSFNHQLVQSEQTGWGDLSQDDRNPEGEESVLEILLPFPT